MGVLIVVGALAIFGLIAWASWYFAKKRREEFAQVAKSLGLRYAPRDPFRLKRLPFALMKRGDGRGAENVMWGPWKGIKLRVFDYWYYEQTRDAQGHTSRNYSRFSCALSRLPFPAPHVTISRENVFTRIADHVGLEDIAYESEEFNRSFNVKCADSKFATDLVDARMMEWLLSTGKEWSFELVGPRLLCYSGRRSPSDLMPLLETMKGFREHVPHVVASLYAPPGKAAGSRDRKIEEVT